MFEHSDGSFASSVCNLQYDRIICLSNENVCCCAARMSLDIGQTLLKDSEQDQFSVPREPTELLRSLETSFDSATFRETFQVPRDRGIEPHLFEHWRVQEIGNGADFFYARVNKICAFCVFFRETHRIEFHLQYGEVLPQTVMNLTSNSTPFFILRPQQV